MAKTNAERQRDYRQRHLSAEGRERRLNTVMGLAAKARLEKLALCYGVTQKALLEELLRAAERTALERLVSEGVAETAYFEGTARLTWSTQKAKI